MENARKTLSTLQKQTEIPIFEKIIQKTAQRSICCQLLLLAQEYGSSHDGPSVLWVLAVLQLKQTNPSQIILMRSVYIYSVFYNSLS